MISDDLSKVSAGATFPPLLEIHPVHPALIDHAKSVQRLIKPFARGVENNKRGVSDSKNTEEKGISDPDPADRPVLLPPSPSKEGKFRKLLKAIPGKHDPKKERAIQIMRICVANPHLGKMYEFDPFVYSLIPHGVVMAIMLSDQWSTLEKAWACLQNDPDSLPALWEGCATEHDNTVATPEELLLFPESSPWQCSPMVLDKLGHLRSLLDVIVSYPAWTESLAQFLQHAITLHTRYGTVADCTAMLELLVSKWPRAHADTPGFYGIYGSLNSATCSPLEREILRLFERCWTSVKILQMSAEFWTSPWWSEFLSQKKGRELIDMLLYVPGDRHMLPEPIDSYQKKALLSWIRMVSDYRFVDEGQRHWLVAVMELARCNGDLEFLQELEAIFHSLSEEYLLFLADDWQTIAKLAGESSDNPELQSSVGQLVIHRLAKMAESKAKIPWPKIVELQRALLGVGAQSRSHALQFMKFCLRFVLYPNASGRESDQIEALLALLAVIGPDMSSAELKLVCSALPFLPSNWRRRDLLMKILSLLEEEDSNLLQVICQDASTREWLLLHIYSLDLSPEWLRLKKSHRLDERLQPLDWKQADLGFLVAAMSVGRRLSIYRLPLASREIVEQLTSFLPPFANVAPSEKALTQWLAWLSSMAVKGAIKAVGGNTVFLALLHELGQWLLQRADPMNNDWDSKTALFQVLTTIVNHKWSSRVLVCDMAMAILLPFVSTGLESADPDARAFADTGDLMSGFLAHYQGNLSRQVSLATMENPRQSYRVDNICQVLSLGDCLPMVLGVDAHGDACGSFLQQLNRKDKQLQFAYLRIARACLEFHLGGLLHEIGIEEILLQFAKVAITGTHSEPDLARTLSLAVHLYSHPLLKQEGA